MAPPARKGGGAMATLQCRSRQLTAPEFAALDDYLVGEIEELADGTASVEAMGRRLFELMLATASGTKTKSELHGYGQNEFVPWPLGAVM